MICVFPVLIHQWVNKPSCRPGPEVIKQLLAFNIYEQEKFHAQLS